jgi:hypothetical protein
VSRPSKKGTKSSKGKGKKKGKKRKANKSSKCKGKKKGKKSKANKKSKKGKDDIFCDETTTAPIGLPPVEVTVTYGTPEEGIGMRKWLDDHALPQSVGDALVQVGARCVDDVRIVILDCPELVSGLAPLDRFKLQKAVKN